ncbi:energy transducer TonB [Stakelama saccharophila]|uniref:Protein TonB n=1 Tax=Stakelama saccharophila TaxID=3075605 RepID=A0ABZ0BB08_9SPHN|nr:energy transducer TonB [Stakelama sp. W311]WNO54038.1 energy transducer TonB [Stakelama sp. W311]
MLASDSLGREFAKDWPAEVVGSGGPARPSAGPPLARYSPPGFNGRAFLLVAAIHLGLGAIVLSAGIRLSTPAPEPSLKTFDVAPPAPPPSPARPAPRPAVAPARDAIVSPDPVVEVPSVVPIDSIDAPAPPAPAAPSDPATPAIDVTAMKTPPAPPAPPAVTPPRFDAAQLDNPSPPYPFQAKRAHAEGVVTLRVLVGADGRASKVRINQSSGFALLDRAARKTVAHWRFLPARRGEDTISAWVLVPITFALD